MVVYLRLKNGSYFLGSVFEGAFGAQPERCRWLGSASWPSARTSPAVFGVSPKTSSREPEHRLVCNCAPWISRRDADCRDRHSRAPHFNCVAPAQVSVERPKLYPQQLFHRTGGLRVERDSRIDHRVSPCKWWLLPGAIRRATA